MKKHILKITLILSCLFAPGLTHAQCPNDNNLYLTGPAPTAVGSTVTAPDTWGGEYNRITSMQAGYTYEISTCNDATFDSELTIYPVGGSTAIAHDDDGCGIVGGGSKIIFTPTTTGDYDILLDEYNCLSNSIDMDVDIKLVSTGVSGPGPAAVTIPVVVHVVYKNATENVSDAQIMSQIDALNRDYRKTNADFSLTPAAFQPLGADMDIAFCLASFDPNGNATTGITRTSTIIQSFDHSNEPKFTSTGGIENWDPAKYLNLWVCDLTGGLLGYATFPTNLATDPQLDGVVVDYAYFGTIGTATAPFHLGRTATHEVGHWLNLRHIWGDANCGDDFVNDTPTQQQANTGCPSFPTVTCSNGPNGDMFMNYMDYSDDGCLFLFTAGQKQRADATLATIRTGLATSNGCGNATGISGPSASSFQFYPNPATDNVTVQFGDDETYTVNIFDVNGKVVFTAENNKDKMSIPVSSWANGFYYAQFKNNKSTQTKKLVVRHY